MDQSSTNRLIEADREWFAQHPHSAWRFRSMEPGERADMVKAPDFRRHLVTALETKQEDDMILCVLKIGDVLHRLPCVQAATERKFYDIDPDDNRLVPQLIWNMYDGISGYTKREPNLPY